MIRFGLIGLGKISRVHLPAYKSSNKAQVVAVCDVNHDVVKQTAADYDAEAYTDYKELLANKNIDAVDIMLPHYMHYSVAKDALLARKHTIVEKPLATTSQEALDLIKISEKSDVKITVAENTRFVIAYIEAKKLIENGKLGKIRLIRTFISGTGVQGLENIHNWTGRTDKRGGIILDCAPHSFYLIKWIFGDIEKVWACKSRLVQKSEVEDYAVISGYLTNGVLFSTEFTDTAENPWTERLEVYGDRGTLFIDQLSNPPAIFFKGNRDYKGEYIDSIPYDPEGWKIRSIQAEIIDFIDSICDNRETKVNPWDAYEGLKVIEKVYDKVTNVYEPKTHNSINSGYENVRSY